MKKFEKPSAEIWNIISEPITDDVLEGEGGIGSSIFGGEDEE